MRKTREDFCRAAPCSRVATTVNDNSDSTIVNDDSDPTTVNGNHDPTTVNGNGEPAIVNGNCEPTTVGITRLGRAVRSPDYVKP